MKKTICLLLAALLLTALFVGCSDTETPETTNASAELPAPASPPAAPTIPASADAPQVPSGFYFDCGGTKLVVGMKYADVKDALGAETAPADEILPCDGGDSFKDTLHHYAGFTVTENIDGVIKDISDDAASGVPCALTVNGEVKIGDTQEAAVAALGEPNTYPVPEDDFALDYSGEGVWFMLYLDPDNNKQTISGFYMTLME